MSSDCRIFRAKTGILGIKVYPDVCLGRHTIRYVIRQKLGLVRLLGGGPPRHHTVFRPFPSSILVVNSASGRALVCSAVRTSAYNLHPFTSLTSSSRQGEVLSLR